MAEADLLDEIDDLKEKIEILNSQLDALKDERDAQVSELEDKVESIREQTEKEWKQKVKVVERESRDKVESIMKELDLMRQAFTGDCGAWVEKQTKSGQVYYENTETGEVRDEEPEVMFIARGMKKIELVEELQVSLADLQKKHKDLEGKKRECDLVITKMKTEMNSLKTIDKLWKESAKAVYSGLTNVKSQFDAQIDQIMGGLSGIQKGGKRMTLYLPTLDTIRILVSSYQQRIATQEGEIMSLNGKIRNLTADLADKNKKVEVLSKGLDEEVERLTRPMRDKISECMVMVMKEKAARAQERRELADLWPPDHLLPTTLMRYRALTEKERLRRLEIARNIQASVALGIEVRANVAESKMWEMKYDDYGRPFYQHMKTMEISEQEPEIISYKPPPGRDELGNVIMTDENDMNQWTMITDNKGDVAWKRNDTGRISYLPPGSYTKLPPGKSRQVLVAEAAQMVLTYIKEKITKHIDKMKGVKTKSETPLSAADVKRIRKERERAGLPPEEEVKPDEDDDLDLTVFQYDIQTVEMLAAPASNNDDVSDDQESSRKKLREFLADSSVRTFNPQLYPGPTLAEVDLPETTIPQLRQILGDLATREENFEMTLKRIRENIKDFSYELLNRLASIDEEKAQERKRIRAEAVAAQKQKLKEEIKRAKKEARRLKKAEAAARAAAAGGEGGLPADGKGGESQRVDETGNTTGEANEDQQKQQNAEKNVTEGGGDDVSVLGDGGASVNGGGGNADGDAAAPTTSGVEGGGDVDATLDKDEEEDDVDSADLELGSVLSEISATGEENKSSSTAFLLGDPDVDDMPISEKSDQIIATAENLSNLALFCGLANLRLENLAEDVTYDFNLNAMKIPCSESAEVNTDDEWLSKSFFMCVTKDRVDAIREATMCEYDPSIGLLNSGPLVTARLLADATSNGLMNTEKPFTPVVSKVNEKLQSQHALWKSRQLMAEVLRYQLQQEACREAIKKRFHALTGGGKDVPTDAMNDKNEFERRQSVVSLMTLNDQISAERQLGIEFTVLRIRIQNTSNKTWVDNQKQFVRINLGGWSVRTESKSLNTHTLEWDKLNIRAILPAVKMRMESFIVEVFDDDSTVGDMLAGSGTLSISELLEHIAGRSKSFDVELKNRRKKPAGTLNILLRADYSKDTLPYEEDPRGIKHEEVNTPSLQGMAEVNIETGLRDKNNDLAQRNEDLAPIEVTPRDVAEDEPANMDTTVQRAPSTDTATVATDADGQSGTDASSRQGSMKDSNTMDSSIHHAGEEDDALSGYFPSLAEQQGNFASMVADLRGDGGPNVFGKFVSGDLAADEILKMGYRPNKNTVKQLPNIHTAVQFMMRRKDIHEDEISRMLEEIESTYGNIENDIERILQESLARLDDVTAKQKVVSDLIEKAREDIAGIEEKLQGVRTPLIAPREPIFERFPEIPYVPKLPTVGAIDARGKKKKQIPNSELKVLLDKVAAGELDGVEWPFGDFWPSQAQSVKLTKELTARNKVLDDARAAEVAGREKQMEEFRKYLDLWESEERKRKYEFEKQKKASRKAYLRLEGVANRFERLRKDSISIQMNVDTFTEMKEMHLKSKNRFKIMRMKQLLESERQRKQLRILKKRLLKALDGRSHALDLPFGATNQIQFDELKNKAEVALRTLRYEIADVRQQLINEGIRMRNMYDEEFGICHSEVSRVRFLHETIKQRDCIEKITARNNYTVMNLLVDLEKLKLAEADRDDRGLHQTVDNLGERYIVGRDWDSAEVIECNKLIAVVMAKIELADGVLEASAKTQKFLMEMCSARWNTSFAQTRDSWVENSDYERAQALMQECIDWVSAQRNKLIIRGKEEMLERNELQLQLDAAHEQSEVGFNIQSNEAACITASATNMVAVLQKKLDFVTRTSQENQLKLERSITELSRELQQVREKTLAAAIESEDRTQILWAFINTLQRTVQTLSAKMEIIIEEREKIVIASKLNADKTRAQLRIERKHCANLMFIMHAQRGTVRQLKELAEYYRTQAQQNADAHKMEINGLRRQIFQQVFCFTRMSTDVDALFDFFASRLANLAGSRKSINDALAKAGAPVVLAALCKSPRPKIRKYAARALGGMGWDSFVETRIMVWDCVMYWKSYQATCLAKEKHQRDFQKGFSEYSETGNFDALLNIDGKVEEFVPTGNLSLRKLIKQRRQWALRAARRSEGPNITNQRMINFADGIIPSLLQLCTTDGEGDWEISRNAALAICIASYELQNHVDMTNDPRCVNILVNLCYWKNDAEVQTHAAITIANLCHRDETAQAIFGQANCIPALLSMCRDKHQVVDLLEAATAALSNLTCYFDPNCKRVLEADGVQVMVQLITRAYTENLLDIDQNDEVQANAVEMLANVSRYNMESTNQYFDGAVVDALIVMCASSNKQVKLHAPLVLGNIGQNEHCREEIGDRGGIEALFLVLEDDEKTVQANCLWALCNLMWHPPNQERAGRFLPEILAFLDSSFRPVVTHAITLLANCLYYNSSNRVRLLETEGKLEMLIEFIRNGGASPGMNGNGETGTNTNSNRDKSIMEGALRCILSLSYLDNVALWLGTDAECIPLFISLLHLPHVSHDVMRYSLEIILNLCVHHVNRQTILDSNGIEAIVNLYNDPVPYVQELSAKIIGHLENVTPQEVLSRMKANLGLERMISLVVDADPLVRAVAAESIGEEIWHEQSKQKRANEVGGVDALLSVMANPTEPIDSLLPSLWSLRNLMHNNPDAQTQFGFRDGVSVILSVLGRSFTGEFIEQTEKVVEASLALLVTGIVSHERNSRRLLAIGLEVLMDIADGKIASSSGGNAVVRRACRTEGIVAMTKSLLLMLGPYNYVVCKNCQKKQDLHGTTCLFCGYRLRVTVEPHKLAAAHEKRKMKEEVLRSRSAGQQKGDIEGEVHAKEKDGERKGDREGKRVEDERENGEGEGEAKGSPLNSLNDRNKAKKSRPTTSTA